MKPPLIQDSPVVHDYDTYQVQEASPRPLIEPVSDLKPKAVSVPTGSHSDWLRAAGVAESDWKWAELLIQKESGWNPRALNRSSGACGLAQALPCSKLGSNWYEPVHALSWGDQYVHSRYESWAQAWSFWLSHHYY